MDTDAHASQVYFVVMRNFLPVRAWLTFDLKGATANRRALAARFLHEVHAAADPATGSAAGPIFDNLAAGHPRLEAPSRLRTVALPGSRAVLQPLGPCSAALVRLRAAAQKAAGCGTLVITPMQAVWPTVRCETGSGST